MYTRGIIRIIRGIVLPQLYPRHIGAATAFISRVPSLEPTASGHGFLYSQTRSYAKSKDKKKEKGKKPKKVEINESQLRGVLNLDAFHSQMQKIANQMKDDLIKHFSVRSTAGAIDTIPVTVDGIVYELQELAQISRKGPKTIVVNMIGFPHTIPEVIKAFDKSGMNLNPQQDGTALFIPIPKVTKEHRENLAKNVKTIFVKHRDAIKGIQNETIKKIKKQPDLSKDDVFTIQTQITALTDHYVAVIEELLLIKQRELLGEV